MSTSPLSPGSAAAVALLSSPERQRTVNTSTFEGYEIKFRDDGHIAGNGISAWIARFVQVLTKLVFFLFTPRQIIKVKMTACNFNVDPLFENNTNSSLCCS